MWYGCGVEKKIGMCLGGSDSGGGAGIQADLKAFSAIGVHGICVVTGLTAQSPGRVKAVWPSSPEMVRSQFEVLWEDLKPDAVKVGALFTKEVIATVSECLEAVRESGIPIVIDPVMVATSGGRLLSEDAEEIFISTLIPQAHLITPNLPESSVLSGHPVETPEDMKKACEMIWSRFNVPCLMKGGHLQASQGSDDLFFDGQRFVEFTSERIDCTSSHGTGCTLSSLIAGHLASGTEMEEAIQKSKTYVSNSLRTSYRIREFGALNLNT